MMIAATLATMIWMAAPLTIVPDEQVAAQPQHAKVLVTVVDDENGEARKEVRMVTVGVAGEAAAEGEEGGNVIYIAKKGEDGKEGERRIRVITRMAPGQPGQLDPNRGWLGIALGMVSEVGGEADGTDAGVVVMNVVKESPADIAGLLEGDVITSVNGEAVTGIAEFAKRIGEIGPGKDAVMNVDREGAALTLTATLAAPRQEFEWMHAPNIELKDVMRVNPKVFFGGKSGPEILNLDELHGDGAVPEELAELMSTLGATVNVTIENGEQHITIETVQDGETLSISRAGEGPIVVTRGVEGEDGVTETEYATPEALEAGDPEAFKVFNGHRQHTIFIGDDFGPGADFDFDVDVDMGKFFSDDMRKRIELKMRSADEAVKDAMGNVDMAHALAARNFMFTSKVTHSFKVNPEGQIEFTQRKGDTEVVEIYRDEADLQSRNPAAYEKYMDVVDGDPQAD